MSASVVMEEGAQRLAKLNPKPNPTEMDGGAGASSRTHVNFLVYKTRSRHSTILPCFDKAVVNVYDGKKFVSLRIIPDMVGHKFGEFCLTRKNS